MVVTGGFVASLAVLGALIAWLGSAPGIAM